MALTVGRWRLGARQALAFVTAALVGLGVLMVYSASITSTPSDAGERYLIRHLLAVACSLAGLFVALALGPDHWRRMAVPFLLVALVLLVLVLVPGIGTRINGAKRWIRLGPINFQPSELGKLATILFLAYFFSRRLHRITSFFNVYVPVLGLMALVCGLVVMEPDFGSSVLIGLLVLLMCFIAGVRKRYLIGTLGLAIPAAAMLVWTSPYRLKRLTGFLQVWEDPLGAGYHARQSLLSLGSGGLLGVGPGRGQQKLSYLPEANTDFIFGVIGEELGLVGTLIVALLFLIFFLAALRLVRQVRHDPFAFFLGLGIALQITIQAVLNIAVVTAVVPTKGLPLPMVSYGGSSLFINLISVGVLLSVTRPPAEPAPAVPAPTPLQVEPAR